MRGSDVIMARSRAKVRTADMDSAKYDELGTLMREFPDWTREFPDLYAELNPIRSVDAGDVTGLKY